MKIEDTYEAGVAWGLEFMQKPQSEGHYLTSKADERWFIEEAAVAEGYNVKEALFKPQTEFQRGALAAWKLTR